MEISRNCEEDDWYWLWESEEEEEDEDKDNNEDALSEMLELARLTCLISEVTSKNDKIKSFPVLPGGFNPIILDREFKPSSEIKSQLKTERE